MKDNKNIKIISTNIQVIRDYTIFEFIEAGIVLLGSEVKSIREGRVNLKDSYATVKDGEIYLVKSHISEYTHANRANHNPERERKLLFKKKEINKLIGRTTERGYTLVPTKIYFKGPFVKVEIGIARGVKQYDKRETIKKREMERETAFYLTSKKR